MNRSDVPRHSTRLPWNYVIFGKKRENRGNKSDNYSSEYENPISMKIQVYEGPFPKIYPSFVEDSNCHKIQKNPQ